jgi:hypothetical protein
MRSLFTPRLTLRRAGHLAALSALAALVLALGACSGETVTVAVTPTATTVSGTPLPTEVPVTPTAGGYAVKVFFSKHPETDSNVNFVASVPRTSPNLQVATYAIQQLIAGPTSSEAATGLYTELKGNVTGSSNCGGPDFTITLNTHVNTTGTPTPQTGTAVLKFCKNVALAGDLVGSRDRAQITATLKQFPTITQVQILNSSGHCFDDASGLNNC